MANRLKERNSVGIFSHKRPSLRNLTELVQAGIGYHVQARDKADTQVTEAEYADHTSPESLNSAGEADMQ